MYFCRQQEKYQEDLAQVPHVFLDTSACAAAAVT